MLLYVKFIKLYLILLISDSVKYLCGKVIICSCDKNEFITTPHLKL